jgi:soluble P-type ATPase
MSAGLHVDVPGGPSFDLQHLVLDVNGTLSTDGELIVGVAERIAQLLPLLGCHLVTADTHGTAQGIAAELGCGFTRLGDDRPQDVAKRAFVERLGADTVAAVGNGMNDTLMLTSAALGICVIGAEGASGRAVQAADLVCGSIGDALDVLLRPTRIVAGLRR